MHIRLLFFLSALLCVVSFAEIKVRNAGIAGDSSARGLKRIHSDAVVYSPAAAVIMFGINDSCNPSELQSIEQYSSNLSAMTDALQASGCGTVVLVSPHSVAEELLLARSPKIAERLGGRSLKEYIHDYAVAAKKTAAQKNVIFLDWHEIAAPAVGTGMEATSILRNPFNCGASDGVHFTPAGNAMLAEAVFKVLNGRVKDNSLVVCIGDSITASVHVPGAGGITGETYPAILWRLLNPALALAGRAPSPVSIQVSGRAAIANAGLEEADGKGRPANFPFWEKGRDRFELLTDGPYSGASFARLSGSPGSIAVARTEFFPVKGGMTFRVSLRIRGTGPCEIIAGTYDQPRMHSLGKPVLNDEWQLFEAEYKVPAGAVRSCIIFNTGGTLDFDELTVTGR